METAELRNAVVLVTSEEHIRKAVSSTLEKAGFIVLSASNADSALSFCRGGETSIQLVIVDAGPGQMNGPDFLERLYQTAPGVRVLFMSNSTAQESGEYLETSWRGCLVLRKPFRRAHLLGMVLEAMSEPLAFTA